MSSEAGGASVGMLSDLDASGLGAVVCLRHIADGPDGARRLAADFSAVMGAEGGRELADRFVLLIEVMRLHGRRPLMRHSTRCPCLGADEACFARMICCAAKGEREDAMLLATLMVRPDMAPAVTALAEQAGLALERMALRPPGVALH